MRQARQPGLKSALIFRNPREIWRRLVNLVLGVESDLIVSKAFKSIEPQELPPTGDEAAASDLWCLHNRKMDLLDKSVYQLVKVQDIVNRLLHESLGDDLVGVSTENWELLVR